MRRLVTVGTPPNQYTELSDTMLVLAPVVPADGTEAARRAAIKEAMIQVVEAADPGDVCCQDDVEFSGDPWGTPLEAGHVTLLTRRQSASHACPRAFRFADVETRRSIVAAWRADPRRACNGWTGLPMVESVVGRHL